MEGLRRLEKLPDGVKQQVINEYGSLGALYRRVIDLNAEEHKLTGSKSPRLAQVEKELLDIEDKLEELGVTDGRDVTSEIASDYGEAFVSRNIAALKKQMIDRGIDFDEMKKWLKDNHDIDIGF